MSQPSIDLPGSDMTNAAHELSRLLSQAYNQLLGALAEHEAMLRRINELEAELARLINFQTEASPPNQMSRSDFPIYIPTRTRLSERVSRRMSRWVQEREADLQPIPRQHDARQDLPSDETETGEKE